MVTRGDKLHTFIEDTLKTCYDLVGATLGPGGMTVVIERQETGLPPIVTKDGVTVYKAIGFPDAVQQVLMETAREASVRTAAEAGDGTTTATILSYSFMSNIAKLTKENPHISKQRIVRILKRLFDNVMEPKLKELALPCNFADAVGRKRLWNVARISANGDEALATAVLDAYDIVGDEGNITITEASGPSIYEVDKIEGYPVPMGYEESCGIFYPEFINDPATSQSILKKPMWILYHGILNDYNEIFQPAMEIANAASAGKVQPAIVVVATGFSDSFKAQCAQSFKVQGAVRIFPLLAPRTIQSTSQIDFLNDVAALTGAVVWNPATNPLDSYTDVSQFGGHDGPTAFECGRYRSSIIGFADPMLIEERVSIIDSQIENAASALDRDLLRERKAKLTSGIAKLVVRGSSNAEVKERRDRAEDAVCAVRTAIKYGALKGGGVTWIKLAKAGHFDGVGPYLAESKIKSLTPMYPELKNDPTTIMSESDLESLIWRNVVVPSLLEPVQKLFTNAGYSEFEVPTIIQTMIKHEEPLDLFTGRQLTVDDETLLDSFSAIRDSLRNSISVASELGTNGGVIAFPRDADLERREAVEAAEYMKAANFSEANSRG